MKVFEPSKKWKWITEKKIMTTMSNKTQWPTRTWGRTRRSSPPTPWGASTSVYTFRRIYISLHIHRSIFISLHIHPAAGRRDPNIFRYLCHHWKSRMHVGSTRTQSVNWYPRKMLRKLLREKVIYFLALSVGSIPDG